MILTVLIWQTRTTFKLIYTVCQYFSIKQKHKNIVLNHHKCSSQCLGMKSNWRPNCKQYPELLFKHAWCLKQLMNIWVTWKSFHHMHFSLTNQLLPNTAHATKFCTCQYAQLPVISSYLYNHSPAFFLQHPPAESALASFVVQYAAVGYCHLNCREGIHVRQVGSQTRSASGQQLGHSSEPTGLATWLGNATE